MNPLKDVTGAWTGTASFRMMPTDEFAEGAATASSDSEAAGWGWSLRYTWVHAEDGEQSGLLLVASPTDDGAITAAWIDSWHQKPYLQAFTGTFTEGVVDVSAEYAPGWVWRIVVGPEGDGLRMVMHSAVPEGHGDFAGSYPVMEFALARSRG